MGYIPPPPPMIEETERYFRAVSGAAEALVALRELLAGESDAAIVLPKGVIVEFVKMQQEVSRLGQISEPPPLDDLPPTRRTRPVTGPTTRLSCACGACGDALPAGAAFCIQCGARV